MTLKTYAILKTILTYILFILFLYTAVSKMVDLDEFLNQIERSPLIPANFSIIVAIGVIIVELIICAFLMIEKWNRLGILLGGWLLAVFAIYVAMILFYSPYVPCSCGGIIAELGWTAHLILNISLALLCGVTIYLQPSNRIHEPNI